MNTGASITRQYTTGGAVTLGHLVKLNTSGQVIETLTTDTSGVIGVAISSAASGLVIDVGLIGEMPVTVDGGCTAANFLTISTSVAGNARCLASPGTNQSLGASLTTLGSAGNITALFSAGNAGSSGAGGSSNPTYTTLAFSATPAFNVVGTGPNTFKITLTGNVTSSTFTNAVAGQPIEFDICQDGTGGRTFAFPANVLGAPTIFAGPNVCTRETFVFDGTNANFNAGGGTPAYTTVTFSATPTFTVSGNGANTFKITLTANVTSSTLTGAVAGQQIELDICQDGTGGRTFVFPATVLGAPAISSTASACTRETFLFDGTNANFNVTAAQVSGTPITNNCVKWAGTNLLTDAGAVCGTGGTAPSYTTVTFSATPTFTVSGSGPNGFKITLTGNVTSSTLSGAVAGQPIEFDICQDATGSRTFVFPANVLGAVPILSAASACIRETFMFDGTNANFNEAALLAADNTWVNPQRFKSGFPWHDVTAYGASGSNATGTAAGTLSSTTITLTAAGDFKNGQGIYVLACSGSYPTSIVSGGGTTTLVAADAAPCTFSGATIFHDDQVAFQNAFNDAELDANQGLVYCPTGNYNIMRAPVAVLGGQITLRGAGRTSCKLNFPSQGASSLSTGFTATPVASQYIVPYCTALLTGTGSSFCPGNGQVTWFDLRDCNSCGQINALAAFTAEVTFRLANLTTTQTILSSGGLRDSLTSAEAFELTANSNGSLTCKLNVAGSLQTITGATGAIVAATTYHAAVSYDGSNIRCFLNGTQVTGSPLATTGTVTQQDYEMVHVSDLAIAGDFPEGPGSQKVTSTSQIDALRLSSNARYTANFTAPSAKFGTSDSNTLIQVNWDNNPSVFTVGTTGAFQLPVYLVTHKQCPAPVGFVMRDLTIGAGSYFATGGNMLRIDNVTFGGGPSGGATVSNCSFYNHISDTDFGGGRWGFASMSGLLRMERVANLAGGPAYPFIFAPAGGTIDNVFLSVSQGMKIGVLLKAAASGGSNTVMSGFNTDAEAADTVFITDIMADQLDQFIMNGGYVDSQALNCTTSCWNVIVQETNHITTAAFNGTFFNLASGQDAIIHHVLNSNNTNPIILNGTLRNQVGVRWTDQPGRITSTGPALGVTFAQLASLVNGTWVYCTDCNTTCTAGGGTGRTCFRENGAWTNSSGGGGGTPCTTTALSAQYNNAGAFGCIANFTWTSATGVSKFSQLANTNNLHDYFRFTDTSPQGFVHRLRNAADNATLYSLDVLGNTVANTGTFTGSGAGAIGLSQGAAQTTAACPASGPNCVLHQAPIAVTPYMMTDPGVAAAGVLQGSISGSGATLTNTLASVIPTSILEFPTGTCTSSTAATSAWDTAPSGTTGAVACITDAGNVHSKPVLQFANAATPEWRYTMLLPPNLTGNADMTLVWQTATVSGTFTINLDVICVDPNNNADTVAFSAGNFFAPAAQTASATANNLNVLNVTNQAWPASCTSSRLAHFRLRRTDTGTAVTASVSDIQITLRRTF